MCTLPPEGWAVSECGRLLPVRLTCDIQLGLSHEAPWIPQPVMLEPPQGPGLGAAEESWGRKLLPQGATTEWPE